MVIDKCALRLSVTRKRFILNVFQSQLLGISMRQQQVNERMVLKDGFEKVSLVVVAVVVEEGGEIRTVHSFSWTRYLLYYVDTNSRKL